MIEAPGVEEHHVTPPRGVVSISATHARTDAFFVSLGTLKTHVTVRCVKPCGIWRCLVETRLRRAA
ncbi:hypothetical protein J2797_000685 [Paraburkholderia terricola]|uniref:hypothetical protein n=1 Tax=Paraburkholderia terricola TaxID=169427 RepID=UPI00285B45A5|nr:hypothetical protein [Paraburkholderia terricola]MDR6490809.1 hypothetical protein [Paraburkholderia terricola]